MSERRANGEPEPPEEQNGEPEAETGAAARAAGLEAQLADCKDRLLRALAEQENMRNGTLGALGGTTLTSSRS